MDRRSLILLILTCGLLVLWYPLMNRLYPPKPLPLTNRLASATGTFSNGVPSTGTSAVPETVAGPATPAAPEAPAGTAGASLRPGVTLTGYRPPAGPAEELVLETPEARYRFTSHGGGLREVELKEHRAAMTWRDHRARRDVGPAVMNRGVTVPMMTVLGLEPEGVEPIYRLSRSNDVVVAERELTNGLRVLKEFRAGSNHVVHATVRIQNWSEDARALPPQEWVFGTAAPLHAEENSMYLGLFDYGSGGNQHIAEGWFANRTLGCLPGTPRAEYIGTGTNTLWSAIHNQFFATVVLPKDQATRVFARHVELPIPNHTPGQPPLLGFQGALLYGGEELPARQERVREFDLYVGPKEYGTMSRLGNGADAVMGFDNYFGGRFSGFFARALLLAMKGLHGMGFSYAAAIIAITVIVRLLFWPLMKASARTSKRMAALQPQIKELQERYKDDPQKMNKKMLELWREHKVNPASGCLPILIQFPILLGFYAMLQTAIELRGQGFLWAFDLSQTDTIGLLPGLGFPINPLPLMMGVTMLWQARLTPMSPSMDPAQQKIMKYMPLMFMVFLYNFSAGLTLYWTVSNLLSILQMKLTRAQDKKLAATGTPGSAHPAKPGRPGSAPPAPGSAGAGRTPRKPRTDPGAS